jgi:hypothetical protein
MSNDTQVVQGAALSDALYHEAPPVGKDQIARWQSALESFVPKSDRMSYLYLRWEPGDPWQPVQRWVLWELLPMEACPPDIALALKGPHPRSTGFYNIRTQRWCDGPEGCERIDRATWEVFQETGRWGMRFWCIQGKGPGHPLVMPWVVKTVKKLTGDPIAEPPFCGDLPYRLPAEDVWAKVAGYDRYRMWRDEVGSAWENRTLDDVGREREAGAEKAAAAVTAWWDEMVMEVLDEVPKQRMADIGWEAKGAAAGQERMGARDDETTRRGMQGLFTDVD